MKRASLLLIILLLLSFLALPSVKAAENPGPWVKTYGYSDEAYAVAIAPNGDIIVAGYTESLGAGGRDAWVLRLDGEGNIIWTKTYGGKYDDWANAVAIAPNGDMIIAGSTNSFGAGGNGGGVILSGGKGNTGGKDVWVLRLDENGNVKWQKTYSGRDCNWANAVALAPNGDIIIAGSTINPADFNVGSDAWVLRLDGEGNVKWQKTYGGSYYNDVAATVAIAPNGDIIVAGYTKNFGAGGYDAWVLRLDSEGNVKWQKTYGGKYDDYANAVAITENGDIIVAGETYSFGAGGGDAWVLKLDENGNVIWQKTYGGSDWDWADAVAIAPNGDIIVAGYTDSFGAGDRDAWVLRLDESGNVKWQKTYGGKYDDYANAVAIAPNGDMIVAGVYGAVWDHDWEKGDAWVLRLPPEGSISWLKSAFGFSFNSSDAMTGDTNVVAKTSSAMAKDTDAVVRDSSAEVLSGYLVVNTQYPSYQKLFAIGAIFALVVVSGSAYTIRRRREHERKLKRARELVSRAEKAPVVEAVKLARQALELAGNDTVVKGQADGIINRGEDELNSILARGDELLAGKKYEEAIKTYESARTLAEALGKTDVLNSKIQTVRNLLEEGRKTERFEALMSELNSALARRDYETVSNIITEAQTLARELGRESTVNSVLDDLRTRVDNVIAKARDAELSGDYASALALYTEALSLAGLIEYDTTEIERAIKSIESRRKEELLKKSVKVDVPTEMPHKAKTEISIIVTNRFSEDLNLTVDLSKNAEYFELSEEKVNFPRVRPGRTIGESVTVKPKFMGDFDFKVRVESNYGIIELNYQVKVTKTARMDTGAAVTPSALTSTPILNPVEALQELYSDFQYVGEGGFARVYKAKRKDGKIVAIKIPKTLDPAVGRAFVREITNWLHLKHPNIVELYDVNVLPVPYLEMEYCESSITRLQKPLPVDEASLIVFNIAEGLKYAHSKKIIHRDLKPSNVLLKNGLPKISDWGLSKVLEESMSATTTASFTPYYAAPEQIDKKYGHTDERTDIYQLGVIFYELVTGRLPFEGTLSQVMMEILRDDPVPPSQLNPTAREVEPIIMRMLAKRKEERYQSIEELQRDLARVLNMTYSESLKESKTLGDVRRATYYLTELLLINLKTNNPTEAYKYASDLAFYVKGELKDEIQKLAEQVKFRLEENLNVPPELVEKAEIIIHKIRVNLEKV